MQKQNSFIVVHVTDDNGELITEYQYPPNKDVKELKQNIQKEGIKYHFQIIARTDIVLEEF